jgi:hypothetical protein
MENKVEKAIDNFIDNEGGSTEGIRQQKKKVVKKNDNSIKERIDYELIVDDKGRQLLSE